MWNVIPVVTTKKITIEYTQKEMKKISTFNYKKSTTQKRQ